jgi:hypothetical protein
MREKTILLAAGRIGRRQPSQDEQFAAVMRARPKVVNIVAGLPPMFLGSESEVITRLSRR